MEYKIFELSKEKNVDEEVEKLFKYWRNVGFPNYDKESYNYKKELDNIYNQVFLNTKKIGNLLSSLLNYFRRKRA